MAKTTKPAEETEELAVVTSMPNPRLVKLIVKNFRCIGTQPVHIDLDDIVVLVGSNNAGKSSLLRAYELVMSEGSKAGEIKMEDFPNNCTDTKDFPEIELHTIVYEKGVGDKWVDITVKGEYLVKERWMWKGIGKPERRGWDVKAGDWHPTSAPFGPANIANSRRPEPHKVDAFSKPDEQADGIKKLLLAAIQEKVNQMRSDKEANEYHKMLATINDIQLSIIKETKGQIDTANSELTDLIGRVFPKYQVTFDAQPESNLSAELFKWNSELLMGPTDGFMSTIDKQGSGARRTLLWTALKYISETSRPPVTGVPSRPHILLIDEPEMCLHPNAIREACKVLYDLPGLGNWQVMVTTHSPIFIDLSRDNTTIVRVERNMDGVVEGTTIFRPDKANLDEDDKTNLKLLNICDPYVAEFLFGGKVVVVEGDTEYTAFNYVRSRFPEEYSDVHIIRARGKATIVSLIKILNHFGASYSVLHDSDTPLTKAKDKNNPAWGNNPNILRSMKAKPACVKVRLLASLPNFEQAYFNKEVLTDKPYNAIINITEDEEKFKIVKMLLDALIDHSNPLPANCVEWADIDQLKLELDKVYP